jgi:hypothetical protein
MADTNVGNVDLTALSPPPPPPPPPSGGDAAASGAAPSTGAPPLPPATPPTASPFPGAVKPPSTGQRVAAGVGGFLAGFGGSGAAFMQTPLGQKIIAYQKSRMDETAFRASNMQQLEGKIALAQQGIDPDTGQKLSPEQQQSKIAQYTSLHDAEEADFQKLAGVTPEVKKKLVQAKQTKDMLRAHAGKLHAQQQKQGAGQGAAPASLGTAGAPPQPPTTPSTALTSSVDPNSLAGKTLAEQNKNALDIQQGKDLAAAAQLTPGTREYQEVVATKKFPTRDLEKTNPPLTDAYYALQKSINPKTGQNYTALEALDAVTRASTKIGKQDAFHEYLDDPKNYLKFEKEMAEAKQSPSKSAGFMSVYSIYRMIDMAYKDNPQLLPLVASLAPQVFKSGGMEMPPELSKLIGMVPLDQPLSPETGKPIGLSMPGAPTAGTRTQAQTAARVILGSPEDGVSPLEGIRKEVNDLAGYLGPTQGRLNVKYLLGKAGSTGDQDKDKKLSKLRTDLTFLGSAAAKFHLNAVRAMEEFESLADAGKDSSAALNGFLDSMSDWAKAAQRQERGYGESGGAPPPPPSGPTPKTAADFLKYKRAQAAAKSSAPTQ